MKYDIWIEGYKATGEEGEAHQIAEGIEASSFQKACDIYAKFDKEFKKCYDRNYLTYWGCKLFDNRIDAQRNFG
jgi:hypothetical protein